MSPAYGPKQAFRTLGEHAYLAVALAAAGDALFSFAPLAWHVAKLPLEVALLLGLSTLNLCGARESVLALAPIFLVSLITHVALLVHALSLCDVPHEPDRAERRASELARGLWSTSRFAIGTDAVEEAEKLRLELTREFPQTTMFAAQTMVILLAKLP